jgi:hypothetical protein
LRSFLPITVAAFLALVTFVVGPVGCGPSPAQEAARTRMSTVASADVAVPPKELVEAVRRVVSEPPLSLGVEQQDRGTILTGWKRYQGEWHIAHHWQERTRFRIDVSPDFSEPTSRSRLSVVAETEQRANEGQRWDREPRVPRPARAEKVLETILERVQPPAGT